jgi:thiamine pyrophosphokinase
MIYKTIIIADGSFPENEIPLAFLRNATKIICCDGGAGNLIEAGFTPDAIVGDLDSLDDASAKLYSDRLFPDKDQETNDLTKAVMWCSEKGIKDLVILGATGKREDHTIGNISLLSEYVQIVNVIMVTDTGIFIPYKEHVRAETFVGQQISIFSTNSETVVNSQGLKFKLSDTLLRNWWIASLNEATEELIELKFSGGPLIVYYKF